MFDNKVDINATYNSKVVVRKPVKQTSAPELIKSVDRKVSKLKKKDKTRGRIDSTKTWNEYQELRKTKEFKMWWWEQRERQTGLCYYCLTDLGEAVINVEHIRPMSAGGTNDYNNMVLSCRECNKNKGSRVLSKQERKLLREIMQEVVEKKQEIKKDYMFLFTAEELFNELNMRIPLERIAEKATKYL